MRARARVLLVLLLAPGLLRAQEAERKPLYGVRPGDQVQIEFFTSAGARLTEVAGTRIVDPNGDIYLPYVGTVHVQGLDAHGIRELLRERFAGFYTDPVVDVTTKLRINVTGAVRAPGHYFVDPTSTIVDALAVAGGVGSEVDIGFVVGADLSRVRLVREGETLLLDLRPDSENREAFDLPVRSGDWLYVPIRKRSRWRDNFTFLSSILSVVGSTAALILLLGG